MSIERRNTERMTTRGSVRFELGGISHFGTMRNLSQAGCMIESPNLAAEIGERCEVTLLPGYSASGRVAWQLGEAVGISFLIPVPSALVSELAMDDWSMRSDKRRGAANG
ncbi:PilZ domain-containing protein [Qipengyuania sp. 1NDH17]|uniref:PilZ domain-containing protein n=1 Tax=Qipengyuania polymorpha TaxID=2867234 RepID=A0ABS7J2J4_9SPHN|nr:PilZ domain-containing protein [Qipengyuania polymorpha]MBX7458545.1 PilZ domain-containing protein [Qipengyuania polymorpha]